MSSSPRHSVSVAGVAFDGAGRVLLIQRRDDGTWQAPGGILELGETIEDGVVREVFEETGVRVRVQRLTGVYKNLEKGVVALVFRCAVSDDGEMRLSTDEAQMVDWIPLIEVAQRMAPAFSVRVLDAAESEDSRRSIPIRSHDGTNLAEGFDE